MNYKTRLVLRLPRTYKVSAVVIWCGVIPAQAGIQKKTDREAAQPTQYTSRDVGLWGIFLARGIALRCCFMEENTFKKGAIDWGS